MAQPVTLPRIEDRSRIEDPSRIEARSQSERGGGRGDAVLPSDGLRSSSGLGDAPRPEDVPPADRLTFGSSKDSDRLTEPVRPPPPRANTGRCSNRFSEDAGRKTAEDLRIAQLPYTPYVHRHRPARRRYSSGQSSQSSVANDAEPMATNGSNKVRLAEDPRIRPSTEVQSALEALSGMPLHIVYVGQGKDDPTHVVEDFSDRFESSRGVYDFPSQVDAVVLLCYVACVEIALNIVQHLKKSCYAPPVLPLLLRSDGAAFDLKDINRASVKLTKAGADDILVQPRDKLDLPDMLQTTLAMVDVHWEVEKNTLDQLDDRANNLFFQSVDRMIQGFPMMNAKVEERASSRANLGGVGKHCFVSVLGTGEYGTVFKTRSGTQDGKCSEAVKVIPKRTIRTPKQANQVMRECRILQRVMGHPKIAEFRGLVHGCHNLYIFMEFVGSTDLIAVIRAGDHGRLESARVLELILQILDAVAYCHNSLVAHRDLKSENIVLTNEAIPKVVDFGLAVVLSNNDNQELCGDACGTVPFVPPEVCRGKRFDPQAMDVWSIGVLAFEMRCGNNSVCNTLGISQTELNAELAENFELFFGAFDWPQLVQNANGTGMAEELIAVMRCCLVVRPELRWKARDLWHHVANSSGQERCTRPTRGEGQSDSPTGSRDNQPLPHITSAGPTASVGSEGSGVTDSDVMGEAPEEPLEEQFMNYGEMPFEGDFPRMHRSGRAARPKATFRKMAKEPTRSPSK